MIIYKNSLSEFVKGDFTSKIFQLERHSSAYYAKIIVRLDCHQVICEEQTYSFLPEELSPLINESFSNNSFIEMINSITEYLNQFGTKIRTIEKKSFYNYDKKQK